MQPSILLPAPPRSGIHRARRLLLCCLLAILSFSLDASAQNLVNNPSFEIKYGCPIGIADLGDQLTPTCANWSTPNAATPEYFNSCVQVTTCNVTSSNYVYMAGVPQNAFGYQDAFDDPNDPNDTQTAYGGIVYVPSSSATTDTRREYLQVSLSNSLEADHLYEISFYVSLADGSSYALTGLGAYLSTVSMYVPGISFLGVQPQVQDDSQFFTDKDNWVQVKGIYEAAGGEDHLIIGYFRTTLESGTDYISVPIDPGDESCYAKALPQYGKFAYYYVDQVSVREIPCLCGPDGYDLAVVKDEEQGDEATECCYQIELTRKEHACDIGNIRISLLPSVIPDASYNFSETYTVAGNWFKTSSSSSTATWTRDPNAEPFEVDITEMVGGLCIRKFSTPRTIVIEYFDDEMNYMCSDVVEIPPCYTPDCCDMLDLQIQEAAYYLPDYCCFSVLADVYSLCSSIDAIRVQSLSNEPIFLLSDPTQTTSPSMTLGRVTLEGQEYIGGNICLSSATLTSFDIRIEYLDAEGEVLCSTTATLRCNCCTGLRTFEGDMCAGVPEGTDPDACCRGVYITQDAGVNCEVYGVVLTGATGGVELQSTPIVLPSTGASGSELQCYGYYCLEPGETRTILVDFLDMYGNVFCTKSITDTCHLVCCESISLGVELPSYPPWNVPDQCCGSIYAMQPSESDCKVYGVNVINADGGIPYDPTRQVSLPNCGNCVRTIVGSYCLEPGETRTITIEFLDISGMVMCTKTLVRSCPEVDACCDKLKAEFVPAGSVGPQPRCCMDIKITKQPGLSCDVYGIRLTGASGGISVQTSPISIPTGNPSNPNTLIVGQVCAPYGQSRTVTVEFLDANGDVLCTKTISFTCPESGGAPGSGGTNKTGAPSDSPLGAVRLQAMPNPTASATTIQYYLPDNAAIKLEVYNSLGRLVAVPEEGFRTMGDHSVTYATDDLPSGMYYIKLAIGDNVVTIPLVVTKK
jgi:hypothetical protein